jgi:hypothetical protein
MPFVRRHNGHCPLLLAQTVRRLRSKVGLGECVWYSLCCGSLFLLAVALWVFECDASTAKLVAWYTWQQQLREDSGVKFPIAVSCCAVLTTRAVSPAAEKAAAMLLWSPCSLFAGRVMEMPLPFHSSLPLLLVLKMCELNCLDQPAFPCDSVDKEQFLRVRVPCRVGMTC